MNTWKTSSLKAAQAIHDAIDCEANGESYEIPSVEKMAEMIDSASDYPMRVARLEQAIREMRQETEEQRLRREIREAEAEEIIEFCRTGKNR